MSLPDSFRVMQNANLLHLHEHAEILAAHNVNCCDGEDSWLDGGAEDGLIILDEVEAFEALWMEPK
jgi:hypothetical protein